MSPVVGVILMVAITVVLAAVVFVLVQGLNKNTTEVPNLVFFKKTGSTGGGTLTVTQADSDIVWDHVLVGVNDADPVAVTAGTPGAGECTLPAGTNLAGAVTSGQVITCGSSVRAVNVSYGDPSQTELVANYKFP